MAFGQVSGRSIVGHFQLAEHLFVLLLYKVNQNEYLFIMGTMYQVIVVNRFGPKVCSL